MNWAEGTTEFQHKDTKTQSSSGSEYAPLTLEVEKLSKEIVDSAFQVHLAVGPGLLEKIYEECLVCELKDRGLSFERQLPVKFLYKNHDIQLEYKIDLLVEKSVIVELKSLETVLPVHKAQTLSYMRLANVRLGLLINFGAPLIKHGISRIIR